MALVPSALQPAVGALFAAELLSCTIHLLRRLTLCSSLQAVGGKVGALTSAAFAAEEQQQFPWHNPQQHSQHCQPLTWEAQKQQQQPLWLLQRRGPWDLQQLQLNQQLCSSMTSSSSRAYSTSAANPMLASSPQPVLSSALAATRHDQQCSLLQQLPQQQQHWHSQLQHLRGVKQLRPYAAAPEPLPRFKKPSKDGRLNRMVIRLPPQVQLELKDQHLIFTGKAGSTSLRLSFLDPTGLVAWQCHTQSTAAAAAGPGTGSLLLLVSQSKRNWRGIQTHINNAVHGVMQGYLVGVTVQGVGYRLEPVSSGVIAAAVAASRGAPADAAIDGSSSSGSTGSGKRRIIWEQEAEKTNIAYPHRQPAQAVRLKVGYTRACIFQLPVGVQAFFVKPTLMYLYGIDKALVTGTAAAIRAIRKPNAYTGNGIQLVGETLRLKQRAGSK